MAQVLLELMQEEKEATNTGNQVISHKVLPVSFLKQGLSLEERQ